MINLNTNVPVNSVGSVSQSSVSAKTEGPVDRQVNAGASAVVDLQTKNMVKDESGSFKVDASNAKSVVADITAMLGLSGASSVQANLNGFDAASLLS
ncbi:MAG: hypothetical protein ACI4UM_05270 [Succinivibrio sp.]